MKILLILLAIQAASAQRVKWKFNISPFDSFFACSTQTSLDYNVSVCQANCPAGSCSDQSTKRFFNLADSETQARYRVTCSNADFNKALPASNATCNALGFTNTMCPIPALWLKGCPVHPTCCISNNPSVPDSTVVGNGTEVRVLSPQLRVGYSIPMDRPLSITIVVSSEPPQPLVLDDDPGVPIGMTFQPSPDNKSITLLWQPHNGQEGSIPSVAVDLALRGSRALLLLPVAAPVVQWLEPPSAADTVITATVGRLAAVRVRCASNYPVTVDSVPGQPPPPPGAAITDLTGTQQFAWAGPLGSGAGGALAGRPEGTARVAYTPPRGAEGSSWRACFRCRPFPDLRAPPKEALSGVLDPARCLVFQVETCRYATNPGDTLLSISQKLLLNNNWRRLWNANAGVVADPHAPLPGNLTLALGPTYTVQAGDTLAIIAGRFSATVKGLLQLNPAVSKSPAEGLAAGTPLCIPACQHRSNPSNDIGNPY